MLVCLRACVRVIVRVNFQIGLIIDPIRVMKTRVSIKFEYGEPIISVSI